MNVKDQYIDERMALYHGDSCEVLREIPDNSVHFEIYTDALKDALNDEASE